MDEIEPFVRAAESQLREAEPRSFSEAATELGQLKVVMDDLQTSVNDLSLIYRNRDTCERLRLAVKKAEQLLEIASYEVAGTARGEAQVESATQDLEQLVAKLDEIDSRVSSLEQRLVAEQEFSKTLREFVDTHSTPRFESFCGFLFAKYNESLDSTFKSLLSEVLEGFKGTVSRSKMATTLVHSLMVQECAIRYAADAETVLRVAQQFNVRRHMRNTFSYMAANLNLLAGNESEAWSSWKRWVDGLSRGNRKLNDVSFLFYSRCTSPYRTILARDLDTELLDPSFLHQIRNIGGAECSFSVISKQRVDALGGDPFVADATVIDPLQKKLFVRFSESVRSVVSNLYVYGPLENLMAFPGVPDLRLATTLAILGFNRKDARDLAENLSFDRAILVFHSTEELQYSLLQRFARFETTLNMLTEKPVSLSDSPSFAGSVSSRRSESIIYRMEGTKAQRVSPSALIDQAVHQQVELASTTKAGKSLTTAS